MFRLISLIAVCLTPPLAAGPITSTMTGSLSSTVGGVAVTNAPFTFVFNGDTANVFNASPALPANVEISNSMSITGFGVGQFTGTVGTGLDLLDNAAGFADPSGTSIILAQNAGFAAWNLATSFGPLSQAGPAYAAQGSFATSSGTQTIAGAQNVSFGATAGGVPEPATVTRSTRPGKEWEFPFHGGLLAMDLKPSTPARRSTLPEEPLPRAAVSCLRNEAACPVNPTLVRTAG
jgi:hypothetical protein